MNIFRIAECESKLIDGALYYFCYRCKRWVPANKMAHFNQECLRCFDEIEAENNKE